MARFGRKRRRRFRASTRVFPGSGSAYRIGFVTPGISRRGGGVGLGTLRKLRQKKRTKALEKMVLK